MIETHELSKEFDGFQAVQDVNLRVESGQVLAMLGPNGAGKTTTVRMLTSILAPTRGWARVAGYDVVRQPSAVRAHVGVLTEQHGLYERAKGLEYLDFFGELYHLPRDLRRRRSLELMERFGLADVVHKRLGDYSKGMKQKLALVRALLHNPPVLLLDEPTSAMDPQSAKQVRDAILELQRDQRTFLITTHNLTEAQLLASRIAIIRHGRIIAQGTLDELAAQVVGQPIMELRLGAELNGLARDLSDMVTIESLGPNWLQYRTADPQTTNPQVVKRLVELGAPIVSLTQVTQTLEDIYLQVVREDEAQEGHPA
ncbi:MAG: ABC transporter ATP-binding protein [Anaerolineae bacterium]|nr:ABC transporter ATP-binding protein [Anaerolineae bacterium]